MIQRAGFASLTPMRAQILGRTIKYSTGWQRKKGVVLDPMIGSGTTAIAAIKSGRRCVGFDINGGYLETAKKRVALAEAAATIADLLPLDEAVD